MVFVETVAAVQLKHITKRFGKVVANHNVSLSINRGEILSLLGENGSGKTTLMKCILGLVPLKKGNVTFGGGADSRSVGYLPQQSTAKKDFPASVEEVVMSAFMGKLRLPFYNAKMQQKALDCMKTLGVDNLKDNSFSELSGGQQQRVLLARALCASSGMLLLDEPVNGLDPTATKQMYDVIKQLHLKGNTVVMISHDIPSAVRFADRILHLSHEGYFFGTVDEYLLSGFGDGFLKDGAK